VNFDLLLVLIFIFNSHFASVGYCCFLFKIVSLTVENNTILLQRHSVLLSYNVLA